jgi:hypothetical protein
MNNRKNIRLLAISAILILFALPIGSGLYPRVYAVTPNLLGVACGYGASTGVFPTPITTKDGTGIASTSCDWAGDIDGDGAFDPLVADNPSLLAAGSGGGFTADIVVNNLNTMLNGFDITIHYDTNTLNAQAIDQSGLVFGGNVGCPAANPQCTLTTVTEINQGIGEVRLAQALLASSVGPSGICNTAANPTCQSANQVLFRIRFDVVGAGSGAISFTAHILTNPSAVAHTAQDGALSTDALYSLINGQSTVSTFIVFWSFVPNPPVPGSPITFSASAGCAYCTGTLVFSWDFSSVDSPTYVAKVDATGSTVTRTAPPTVIGRVTLTVSDGAHKAFATRGLPLTAAATLPASTGTGTPSAPFAATWVGGTPPYTGSWLFCPGSASVTSVCSSPTVPVTTNGQSSTVPAVTFNFAGSYNTAFTVSDPVVVHNLYTVTGTPAAYTVAVTCNCTKTIEAGAAINFTAAVTYASTYPTQFRSSSFSYVFSFGDGSSQTVSGGLTASTTHRYTDPGNFTTRIVAQETGANAVAKIQETGLSAVTSVFDYALSILCNTHCTSTTEAAVPSGVLTSITATVTAKIIAGTTQEVDLAACKGVCTDGNAFFKGINVGFAPAFGNPSYTSVVTINVTATAAPGVYDITIGGSSHLVPERDTDIIIRVGSLAANFGPTTTIVGKTSFVSKIVGGLKPYSCSWNFGDGSALDTSSCNPSHTYIAAGNFTVTLTVTDSDTPTSTFTVSHFVIVQPSPEFSGRGVITKSSTSVGSTQTFKINADNPSAFNMTVTVKIDIFRGPGAAVASLTTSITIPAGSSTGVIGQIRLSFTPTIAGTYTFTATLTYSGTVPVPPTNGATAPAVTGSAIVSGTGGLRSGTFVAG